MGERYLKVTRHLLVYVSFWQMADLRGVSPYLVKSTEPTNLPFPPLPKTPKPLLAKKVKLKPNFMVFKIKAWMLFYFKV